jgi:hypothetical protein
MEYLEITIPIGFHRSLFTTSIRHLHGAGGWRFLASHLEGICYSVAGISPFRIRLAGERL